jgi:hypothetical protein
MFKIDKRTDKTRFQLQAFSKRLINRGQTPVTDILNKYIGFTNPGIFPIPRIVSIKSKDWLIRT